MEFVVLLSVFAITLTQVIARPSDTDYLKTKDGIDDKADDFGTFKFTLPTAVRNNFQMIINGTLNLSHQNFNATLPIVGGDDKDTCKYNYNYERKKIEVSPALEEDFEQNEPTDYYIFDSGITDPQFTLYLEARDVEGKKMFQITFHEHESGLSPTVNCKIVSFDNFSHILFKEGVKKITSIVFKFDE